MQVSRSSEAKEAGASAADTLRALDLLARWRRVAGAHVPLSGMGCAACGYGAGGLAVKDFEVPILDYLYTRHRERSALRALFDAAGHVEAAQGQVTDLLAEIARCASPVDGTTALLDDLERSMDSFARAHR